MVCEVDLRVCRRAERKRSSLRWSRSWLRSGLELGQSPKVEGGWLRNLRFRWERKGFKRRAVVRIDGCLW